MLQFLTIILELLESGAEKVSPIMMDISAYLVIGVVAIEGAKMAIAPDRYGFPALLKKFLLISIVLYIMKHLQRFIPDYLEFFANLGVKAGGGTYSDSIWDLTPIWDNVLDSYFPLLASMVLNGDLAHPLKWGFYALVFLGILIAHFIICLNLCFIQIDAHLLGLCALVILPLSILGQFASLQRCVSAFLIIGLKITMLTFFMEASKSFLSISTVTQDTSYQSLISLTAGYFAIAILMWHSPRFVTSLLVGAPSSSKDGFIHSLSIAGIGASSLLVGARALGAGKTIASATTASAVSESVKKDGGPYVAR